MLGFLVNFFSLLLGVLLFTYKQLIYTNSNFNPNPIIMKEKKSIHSLSPG
jgi:hypothetical protein